MCIIDERSIYSTTIYIDCAIVVFCRTCILSYAHTAQVEYHDYGKEYTVLSSVEFTNLNAIEEN